MSIAALLEDSRLAHQVYRDNVARRIPIHGTQKTEAVAGNVHVAGNALWRALRARTEAHALDPQQVDPAWCEELVTHDHDALLDFYVQQLTR